MVIGTIDPKFVKGKGELTTEEMLAHASDIKKHLAIRAEPGWVPKDPEARRRFLECQRARETL
ncbi:MAG: hypothetical protein GF331_11515 [Chitinivibrionales bacterium]|nr:hypothetical protein [Chitinivibrionales bacterium]